MREELSRHVRIDTLPTRPLGRAGFVGWPRGHLSGRDPPPRLSVEL